MISRVLFPNEVGCGHPEVCQAFCGADTCSNFAYTKLVFEYMPSGMRGVMFSVMLSALISDLTSIFNSSSTLFTMDIWLLFRPKAADKEKIYVGKAFIVFLVAFSVAWIPVIEKTLGGELYIYIQSVAAYLSPPIAAVYTLAILWPRMNEPGAFWGLMIGLVTGGTRMCADFAYKQPTCFEVDTRPLIIRNFHYLYFAMFLFWVTIAISVSVSLCTLPTENWRLIRTTYATRHYKQERSDDPKMKLNIPLTVIEGATPGSGNDIEKDAKVTQEEEGKRQHSNNVGYSNHESLLEMEERIQKLTVLTQETWQKVILRIVLFIIICVAIILFIIFSINPFSEEEIENLQGPIIRHNLNLTNS